MRKLLTYASLMFFVVFACSESDDDPSDVNDQIAPRDFLSASKYDRLIVEIQYVETYRPSTAAVNNLKTFLQDRLNKPTGITVLEKAVPTGGKSAYSANDIRAIEKANRTQNTNGKTLTAYFLFIDGDYSSNSGSSKVLGIAYEATSMAIFEKTIKEFSGGLGQPSNATLETTVMLHEFGHILGLVNTGTSMVTDHQDDPHGHHCNVQNCLMYYTAETSDVVANITGGHIPVLDAKCIDDLKANGGK
jgi:hypothetical protein